MQFKECFRWISDDKPETTPAIIMVSECGTVVKSMPYRRWNHINKSYRNEKESIRSQSIGRNYLRVSLGNKGYSVHRLVATAWHPNPNNYPQVNHIDGVKTNNHAENLEWCTSSHNQKHASDTGLRVALKAEETPSSKLTNKQVEYIKRKLKKPYRGIVSDLAKEFNVKHPTISNIRTGATWRSIDV